MSYSNPASHNAFVRVPSITLGIGLVLGIAVIAAMATYFYIAPAYHEALLFFAAACAAAGQLAAAFYAARVLELTMRSNQTASLEGQRLREIDNARHKQECARQFGSRWNDATMFHVRQQCQAIMDAKGNQEAVRKIINENQSNLINVKHILNFLEELAVSIKSGLCDEALSKALFCGIVLNLWHSVDFYVREHRTHRGRPLIWAELESLYDVWKI